MKNIFILSYMSDTNELKISTNESPQSPYTNSFSEMASILSKTDVYMNDFEVVFEIKGKTISAYDLYHKDYVVTKDFDELNESILISLFDDLNIRFNYYEFEEENDILEQYFEKEDIDNLSFDDFLPGR